MKLVLAFLKDHWISLSCGVATMVFLVFGFIGMGSTEVVQTMDSELRRIGASDIARLAAKPKNDDVIQAEKARGAAFKAQYELTRDKVEQINRRTPLLEDVFPQPKDDPTRLRFREAYVDQIVRELPKTINGGTLPTEEDIAAERENVEDLILMEEEQKAELEAGGATAGTARKPPGSTGRQPPVVSRGSSRGSVQRGGEGGEGGRSSRGGEGGEGGRSSRGGEGGEGGGGRSSRGGSTPSINLPSGPNVEPKYDYVFRARVAKATSILCYYDPSTFFRTPIVLNAATPPLAEDMWCSQVSLWIEQDVARAISTLNDEFAKQVADTDAHIEHVPVKRLVSVFVHGYAMPDGKDIVFPADASPGASLAAAPAKSFTGRTCNETYDVVRFSVSAIVDQRQALRLIEALNKVNFFQCIGISYDSIDRREHEAAGYLYGTAPVVQITLDMEAYLMRDIYAALMPDKIKEQLGIKVEKP